jgi:hypothetical protein
MINLFPHFTSSPPRLQDCEFFLQTILNMRDEEADGICRISFTAFRMILCHIKQNFALALEVLNLTR